MSGGTVKTAGDALKTITAPAYIPAKAGFDLVTKGANPLKTVGKEIGKDMNFLGEKVVNPIAGGIAEGMGQEPMPNIAEEDPSAVAENAKKERARVKRQTEIDILTDRPGRGGTILTDDYSYRL